MKLIVLIGIFVALLYILAALNLRLGYQRML
jgi:hypothetical protein